MSPADYSAMARAEEAFARDLVREHGALGALRLAAAVVRRVVARIGPASDRATWTAAVVVPLTRLVEGIARAESDAPVGPRPD